MLMEPETENRTTKVETVTEEGDVSGPGLDWKVNRAEADKEVYFFERHNGSIIEVGESEAWTILRGGQKVIGPYIPPPKLIGVGDGKIFQQAVVEAQEMYKNGKDKEEVSARVRKGREDELEAARGKIKMPRNFDATDQGGNPVNLGMTSIRL